ncbi:MAG: transposase [Crocinitomicaceae bacterium]|nr:transposase [Crocinitomicaceae bacterium]
MGNSEKRIIGSYHKISIKYFQEYLNEIAFKFNYKKNEERFNTLVNNMISRAFPFSG